MKLVEVLFFLVIVLFMLNCEVPKNTQFSVSEFEVLLYGSSFRLSIEHDSSYCGTLMYYNGKPSVPEVSVLDYDTTAKNGAINIGEFENCFFYDAKYIVNFSGSYSIRPPLFYDEAIRFDDRVEYYNSDIFQGMIYVNRWQLYFNGLQVSRSFNMKDTLCNTYDCFKYKLPKVNVEFMKIDSNLRQFVIDEGYKY